MSLLADLLSKNKAAAQGDKKGPSTHNIPPTLSKAHGTTSRTPKIKKRHLAIILVSVASIVFGALLSAKFKLIDATARKKLSQLHSQEPPTTAKTAPVDTPAPSTAPSAAPSPAGPTPQARITLSESAAPAPLPKYSVPHKSSKTHNAPAPIREKSPAMPKAGTVSAPARIERPPQPAPVQPRQRPAAQAAIDTPARDALLYAARSAEQANDWKSALNSYRKAQEIDPGNYKIMSNLAAAFNNLGMFDEGVQEAELALSRKPDYVPALINAAIGYSSKGNIRKAVRLFTSASAIDPGNRSLVINLGILHERSGNLEEAQATYRPLANAGDPQALEGLGRIYERKGNKGEAVRTYRQILRTASASPALRKEVKVRLERLEE